MDDITNRQTDILQALIKEYTESGEAVGSEILEKKYKLGVSPATIRNEMVELAKKGYLKKDYFSSGRIPSGKGFRFYIKNLMKEKEVSTTDEVSYKNSIWDERNDNQRLFAHAAKALAQKTGLLSVVATDEGDVYYSGVGNLLSINEFLDWDLSRTLFGRLDELAYWSKILDKVFVSDQDIYLMLGADDFNDPHFDACASVFGEFQSGTMKGIIGIVGPKRMYYDILVPHVRYFSHLIGEIMQGEQKAA